ncbi:hypothetical protein [Legionella impletisoli]|nr:hypothetical protein [Legionella impletisoli]
MMEKIFDITKADQYDFFNLADFNYSTFFYCWKKVGLESATARDMPT